MKIPIRQPRLKIYSVLIGDYDLCDKYKFSSEKFTEIKIIVVHSTVNGVANKDLSLLFFKEFITKQRSNIYRSKKLGLLEKLVTTLRKSFLYFHLEILFSLYLLRNKPQIVTSISHQHVNLILNFGTSHFLTKHIIEKLKPWNFTVKFNLKLVFERYDYLLKTFLFYYFIR